MDPLEQPEPVPGPPERATAAEPPPLPEILPPPARGPGPALKPAVLDGRRASRLAQARTPGRGLRMFLIAVAVAILAGITAIAVSLLQDGPMRSSPWPTAERFVGWLALGPEPDGDTEAGKIGYVLAHDLFTERLANEVPWIDFHQRWTMLTRQHGDVMAKERLTRRRSRRERGRRRFRYRLRLGSDRESHQDMIAYYLEFTLKRTADGQYLVDAYQLTPWDETRR